MIDDIEFRSDPVTLADAIDVQKAAKHDYEAIYRLLTRRTTAPPDRLLALSMDDIVAIMARMGESLMAALKGKVLAPESKQTS